MTALLTVTPRISARPLTGSVSPALRAALVLWLVVGVAAGIRTLVQPTTHTVFPIFAAAAERWWNDQPLYANYKPLDYFRYPPPSALLFGPFAAAGLRAGGVLWIWFGLGVYAAGLWRFRHDVLPAWWTPRRETAFFALATAGSLAGVWNGQSNALTVGLLLLGAAALARDDAWQSAGWLAAAVAVKLTPLPIVLLLCVLWPRRLAGRFAIALVGFALVPFLTRPPAVVLHHYADWLAQNSSLAHERWPGFRDAWTVWQVARHSLVENAGPVDLKEPLDSPGYRALQLIAAIACLGWCLAQRRRCTERRELLLRTLGAGAAWLMLFGPAIEYPTYVFLAPFLALAVVDPDSRTASRVPAGAASVLILTLGWGALSLPLVPVFPAVLITLPAGTVLFAASVLLTERLDESFATDIGRREKRGRWTSFTTARRVPGSAPVPVG
jgi:Glycosyltransferase family 87